MSENPVTDAVTDKIGHPVFGAYIWSFLVVNWEIAIALLGAPINPKESYALISDFIANKNLWLTFSVPLLPMAIYILAGRWVAAWVMAQYDKVDIYLERKKYQNLNGLPTSAERFRELYSAAQRCRDSMKKLSGPVASFTVPADHINEFHNAAAEIQHRLDAAEWEYNRLQRELSKRNKDLRT